MDSPSSSTEWTDNQITANFGSNEALDSTNESASSDASPDLEISPTEKALFEMPAGDLKTECSVAELYPDHRAHPAFYAYPSPPIYDRYLECLLAEARRDGGRVRQASSSSFPKVGECYLTRITWIGSRFGDNPSNDAGTQVGYDIGLDLVDYSYVAAVARSRVGDQVRVCVHDLPQDCPGYDLRGIEYKSRNLRTDERWIMSDSQHMCRGA